MEGFNPPEAFKPITKEEAVASLQENPEDRSVLDSYAAQEEKNAATRKGEFAVQLRLAEIYRDAGRTDEALALLWTAKEQAYKEDEHDSYVALQKAFSEFGGNHDEWEKKLAPSSGGSPA